MPHVPVVLCPLQLRLFLLELPLSLIELPLSLIELQCSSVELLHSSVELSLAFHVAGGMNVWVWVPAVNVHSLSVIINIIVCKI